MSQLCKPVYELLDRRMNEWKIKWKIRFSFLKIYHMNAERNEEEPMHYEICYCFSVKIPQNHHFLKVPGVLGQAAT